MARYVPPEIIEEIRTRVDIVSIISDYVSLKRQGKNYVGLCPFHFEDTPSFTVSPDRQIFYCFGCQKGGNVINFIMEYDHLTLPDAAEKLAEKVGVTISVGEPDQQTLAKQSEKKRLTEMHEIAAGYYHRALLQEPAGRKALGYLTKRGVSQEMITKFQLGYATDTWHGLCHQLERYGFTGLEMAKAGLASRNQSGSYFDRFRNRLMFPIWDYRGKIIGFGGRVLGEELPKYLNSPETPIFNKSQNLYAINLAAGEIRNKDQVIIMEGYMDVLTAHQYGIKNAVASLGTSFTPDQGKLLKRYTSNVLIAYDADTAGVKATSRGLEILQNLGFRVNILSLPNGLDPDDFLRRYNEAGWQQLTLQKTISLFEYKLQLNLQKFNTKTITGKADAVKELLPDLAKIKSQVEKDQYIKLIAGKLDIPEDTIYMDLRKLGINLQKKDNFISSKHTTNRQLNFVVGSMAKARDAFTEAENKLVRFMINNENIFKQVETSIGLDFPENNNLGEIIKIIKQNWEHFNWSVSSLADKIEDPELKNFLFQFLLEDYPDENEDKLIQDCLKTVKLRSLQRRISELQKLIGNNESSQINEDTIRLLQEYTKLQKQVQQLKQ